MIATTDSGDANADLEAAKNTEITCCSRVGKFRHNKARLISVTFMKWDDKEAYYPIKENYLMEFMPMRNILSI